ncbi:ParA family protein [Peribacillus frigoritolerans]|uniref:ParA family protein n=1 Tax=Peribacillus frigoritolerans TaxID=450367 RepID=UPI00331494E1
MGEKRATVITVGLQKGGVGKSTSSGILSYFLSREGYKVLAVDMDSQGNLIFSPSRSMIILRKKPFWKLTRMAALKNIFMK